MDFLERVEQIRRHDLIPAGGEVTCLVSGGADSGALWHALRELQVRGLRAAREPSSARRESDEDARFCADVLGAEGRGLRRLHRGRAARPPLLVRDRQAARHRPHGIRPGRDRSLHGWCPSGKPGRIKPKREDGVVRPLLGVWRDETEAYCRGRRAPIPHRLHQPGDEARADPRPDHLCSAGSTSARRRTSSRSPRAVRAARPR